ncbi:MAG: transposase [Chitinophagales bacterium]
MIDNLIETVRSNFEEIKDHRASNSTYTLVNLLMTGFAMFSLKDPSLSHFRGLYPIRSANLERVYGIDSLPSDIALREGLDGVSPSDLQSKFKAPIDLLSKKGVFKSRYVLDGYVAIPFDATGHYCSNKKGCPQCLVKNHKNGKQTFYHQLLGAAAVHPKQSTVFPIACEAIVQQDGNQKNDCELNACKRLIPKVRKMLPNEKIIAIFDALYPNGFHIKELEKEDMRYVIGIKGQSYVNIQVQRLREAGKLQSRTWQKDNKTCTAYFTNGLILNGTHLDVKTNYFEYKEVDNQTGKQVFYSTWITDIPINEQNIEELVAVARARWKIENETFNTLKNQGYHLEHNYGHGKKHLTTNFALLTFLAFLVDQIAQHMDTYFQKAKATCGTFKAFWERIRGIFYLIPVKSMRAIYKFICLNKQLNIVPLE